MLKQDVPLRTGWFGYRKLDVENCIAHIRAAYAAELRLARQTQQGMEETMAQLRQENKALRQRFAQQAAAQAAASVRAEGSDKLQQLTRKLEAAHAEIRRYQTRLYACEREMVALRQENAELEALCEQARANSLLPPVPPQPKVLEQPGLPVIVFHPAADAPKAEQPQPDAVPEQSAPEQEPAPQAAPPEPEEERCPFAQPDWKPTTALDHQAVDLVHQLESLMTV